MQAIVDRATLSPRHWAVLGVLRVKRGPVAPEAIAAELHFEVDEVRKLLSDLQAAGYIRRPPSD